ncbi:hypothetical protein C8R46DRAFT_1065721 [Mycena filopes]|nr:hypothetical protein C8R46DRAFT_1065721 [Mycena filopes]
MAFHEAMAKAVTGIPRSRGGSLPPGQDIAVPETHVDDVEDDIDDIGVEIKIEVDSNDTQDVSATEVEGILLNVDLASFSKKSGQEWRCQIPRPYGLPDVDWLHGCVIDLGPLSMVIEYNKDSRVYEFALIVDQTKLEELVTKLADLGDKASFTYTPANDPRTNNITIQSALAATGRTTVKALTKLGGKRAIVAAGVGAGPAMCAVTAVDILLSLYRTYRRAEVEAGLKLTGKFGQVEFEGGVSIKSLTPPTRKQVNISLTTTYPVLKKWPPFILKLLGDIEISGVLEPGDRMPHDLSLEGKLKLQLVLKLEFDPTKLLEFEWSGGPDQRGGGGGGGPGGRSRGHRGRGGGPRDRGGRGGGGGPRGGGGGRGGGPGGRGAGPEGGGTEILGEETLAMGRDTAFYLAGDAMVKTATQTTMNVSSDMMVEETTETLTQCLAENIVQAGMDTAVDKASEIMLEAATHTTINVLSEKVIEKSTEKFVEFTAEALQEEILEEAVTFESVEVFTQTMFGLL